MCLITFAYDHHPDYLLILAANRDEFYQRPSRKAQFWDKEGLPDLLAGRDLKAGGTWMGAHKQGKWGAITNFRDMRNIKADAPSRGDILPDFLTSDLPAEKYLDLHEKSAGQYNGHNLLLGSGKELHYFSNQNMDHKKVTPGIHGISNAYLNTPWPKVEKAKNDLLTAISGSFNEEDLFSLLRSQEKAPDKDLPETGLEKEWEKALSSAFISIDGYGTRCSTILMIGRDGNLSFTERRYEPGTIRLQEESKYEIEGFLS